jgi:hypothetical protein
MQFGGWLISIVAAVAAVSIVQQPNAEPAFIVNGRAVPAGVIQSEGHFYVEIGAVAHAIGGSVELQPNQILMSFPGQHANPTNADVEGLSKEFQRASISALGDMRQWVGAVSELISTGVPVAGQWPREYRERVDHDLTQASLAASTNSDRQTTHLLQMLYRKLGQWSDTVVAERNALNGARNVDPNALENDKVLAAIRNCGQFLGSMIVSGRFADDASCH